MSVKPSRRVGGKSKPKKKAYSSAKKKVDKTEIDKAKIKKAVDEISGLIVKEMSQAKSKKMVPEEDDYLSEQDFLEIKKYLKPKKTYPFQYQPKKDTRKKFIWIGVLTISAIIFGMWIWNVWSIFYDVSEYKKGENSPSFLQNVKISFDEALKSSKMENEDADENNNLQEAVNNTEGKEKLEEVLGMLIAELNTTSTTSTIDMETNTTTSNGVRENISPTLEKIIEKLKNN